MRKSRSSHVKCDCGEKTSKCAHLQPTVEGHTGESPPSWRCPTSHILTPAPLTETCCCNHGGRCSCAHKKELQSTLDTVPESDSEGDARNKASAARPKLAARRRRANTVHSDGVLSFDQNGHHKPASKHNRTSQKVGPYQLNRVNSTTSTSSLGAGSDSIADARRGAAGQRRVKSEAASPLISGSGFQMNSAVPPLDLSAIDYPSYVTNGNSGHFDLFGAGFSPDHDGPLYSAGLSATSVDWSHYDLPGDNFGPSSYSQAGTQSFGNFPDFGSNSEHLPHLVNTTSTSGEVSEVEDFMPGAEGDFSGGFMRQSMMGNGADISSIDYDSFYKNAEHNPIAGTGMSMVEEDPAFWMPNYNDGIMDESPDPMSSTTAGNFWEL